MRNPTGKRVLASLLASALAVALAPSLAAAVTSPDRPGPRASARAPEPRLRIANVVILEGDDGVTRVVFMVTASRAAKASVRYRTVDQTAVAGLDYTASTGKLSFTAEKTACRIVIEVLGDQVDEADETFQVRLSRPRAATIARGSGRATISDDDEPDEPQGVSISVGDATVGETHGTTTGAGFTVTLSAVAADPVTVEYATSDGSATTPADYRAVNGTLTFDPGETARQVVVPVVGDTVTEANETFSLNLTHASGAAIADGVGIGTITDDDLPSIAIGNATVTESNYGTVNAVFNVTLSAPSAQTVSVDYATSDGSATAPDDYLAANGTLTFAPGQTVRQIVVSVVGDTVTEISETFSLNLTNPVNATVSDAAGLGTITDNNNVSITIANVTVTEGNWGTVNAVFNVSLSAASESTITVDYATADSSATAPDDYLATSGTLTFAPGEVSKQIIVLVVGDAAIETNEVYSVRLSNPVNATISGSGLGTGTITDNDTVSITIASVTATEGNSGTQNFVFNVTLSAVSGSTVTVDYATANGSATAPSDYLSTSGTLTFAPGEVSKQIIVLVVGDTVAETNEVFSVDLSNPVNATIGGAGYGLGTINNND